MNPSGTLFAEPLPEATEEPSAIEFVDSHMHLDLLLQRTKAASLDQLAQKFHRDDWSVTKMVAMSSQTTGTILSRTLTVKPRVGWR